MNRFDATHHTKKIYVSTDTLHIAFINEKKKKTKTGEDEEERKGGKKYIKSIFT